MTSQPVTTPEQHPSTPLIALFVAKQEFEKMPKSREVAVAITELEKLIAWVSLYVK